jgi:hypothetical protein
MNKGMNRNWQYSDANRRRAHWTMRRIIRETRDRQMANASVRRPAVNKIEAQEVETRV